jgi:hypothetical protein
VGLADRLCLHTSMRSPPPALVSSRVPRFPYRGGDVTFTITAHHKMYWTLAELLAEVTGTAPTADFVPLPLSPRRTSRGIRRTVCKLLSIESIASPGGAKRSIAPSRRRGCSWPCDVFEPSRFRTFRFVAEIRGCPRMRAARGGRGSRIPARGVARVRPRWQATIAWDGDGDLSAFSRPGI